MTTADLQKQIRLANAAYRSGDSIITDEEYDALLDKLEDAMGMIEYECFKRSLTESKGTVENSYVLGSLSKFKYEESDKLHKWINEQNIDKIFVSDKIDGASFYAEYRNGKLTLLSSRGDGDTGTDWTDKATYLNIPLVINHAEPLDVRGELTLIGDSYLQLGFKMKRTGTVGIMNAKDIEQTKLCKIHAIAYEVLNGNHNIKTQFDILKGFGFRTPEYATFVPDGDVHERIKDYYQARKAVSDYDMDGMVLSDVSYVPENTFFPKGKVAFKINSTGVKTTVKGIEWNISKGGLMKPVVLVEAIEIDGSTVQRATGFNAKYIQDNQIGVGTTVYIIKSGEIIPKIIKVEN